MDGGQRNDFYELLAKVRGLAEGACIEETNFLAVQVNVTGENGGTFYIEVKDHKINVEPYEYNDRHCALTMDATNFNKLIDGRLDPIFAFTTGKLKVDGDLGKALEFSQLLK